MRRTISSPVLLAAVVFLVGIAVTWVGPDSDWPDRCPYALFTEGSGGVDVTPSVWPPGTRCAGTTATARFIESTYIPWREWLGALAAGAFAGALAAGSLRLVRRRRPPDPANDGA